MLKRALVSVAAVVCLAAGPLMLGGAGAAGEESKAGVPAATAQPAGGGGDRGVQPARKRLRIGVSIPAADHGWTAGVKWWADKAAAMYPEVDWSVQTAANPEKQTTDIDTMLVKGVDGLVILATESAPLTPVAKRAKEQGVFVVNVDRGFLEPVADIFLEGDNDAFGRTSAEFMVRKLNGKGSVVILEGIPSTVNTARVNAANEVFRANPGIKVLASQPAMWNRQKALEVMQTYLTRFPKIDAVWASDDDMALGAIQAIKEASREGEMWVFPGAGMKEVVKMVLDKDPMVPANVTYSPSMIATGMHLAVAALRDGKAAEVMRFHPRHLKIDVELITPENAGRYYFPDAVY